MLLGRPRGAFPSSFQDTLLNIFEILKVHIDALILDILPLFCEAFLFFIFRPLFLYLNSLKNPLFFTESLVLNLTFYIDSKDRLEYHQSYPHLELFHAHKIFGSRNCYHFPSSPLLYIIVKTLINALFLNHIGVRLCWVHTLLARSFEVWLFSIRMRVHWLFWGSKDWQIQMGFWSQREFFAFCLRKEGNTIDATSTWCK